MADDLKLQQKIYDMMKYAYPVTAQFPKSEKFTLVADIKKQMDILLERCIEAKKKYFKKSTLQEMDVANEKLMVYIRLSCDLHYISLHTYGVWADKLVEIGKMIGGWLKAVNGQKTSS